ncbi:hypothetical protein AEP_01608 [Curvibacter sp. AEP1-3]|uniref:RES domain-containing protein n=1 Tax=Curvibacter sp. AEP1-3 TaxID=1844971 RepID=UPI000B3C79EF|nr:hypothetical protein AEP_01608 [Curvibacter sp. AEP1-3]
MTIEKISNTRSLTLQGRNARLCCLDPGYGIHRLYRFPEGGFKPAPPQFRNGRLDPPVGRPDDYGMLYAADSLLTAALECGALLLMPPAQPTYEISLIAEAELPPVKHVILRATQKVKLVDFMDSATASAFGLNIDGVLDHLPPWRQAAAQLIELLRQDMAYHDVVGVCYRS